MRKQSVSKTSKIEVSRAKDQKIIKYGNGKFVFYNDDTYDGEYKFHYEKLLLTKQGKGVYTTDNFDVYNAEWDNDTFADSEIHIRYNNDAEYRGKLSSNGTMNGPGTYTFPNGSTIQADWVENKPFTNIVYREPLGFAWIVENMSENSISFSSGNYFWNDVISDQSTAHSIGSVDQNEFYQPSQSTNGA